MAERPGIKLLVVDDSGEALARIVRLLELEREVAVVGTAADGAEAIVRVDELHPDIVLMDVNMPTIDGIAAAETIATSHPDVQIVLMSVQADATVLRRAILAGARDFLIKPFGGDELVATVRKVYGLRPAALDGGAAPTSSGAREGKLVAVYSPKGGVGCTTIAANLAIALASRHGQRVLLLDLDLGFGDVALLLNMPTDRTIVDAVPLWREQDAGTLDEIIQDSPHLVRVLLAAPRPEAAEVITAEMVRWLLAAVRPRYDYVVCDTRCSLDDVTLGVLDAADQILLLMTLEVPAIKDTKLFLEVCDLLNYSEEKVKIVVNRADSSGGIRLADVEVGLKFKTSATIVSEGRLTTFALNQGIPFVVSNPDSNVAQAVFALADSVVGGPPAAAAEPTKRGGRLFGLLRSG